VQRTVPSKARDLLAARKDPSIRLRRPQDDSLASRIATLPPVARNDGKRRGGRKFWFA